MIAGSESLVNEGKRIVRPRLDLTGCEFGALKVIGLSDNLAPRGKRMVPLWICQCQCGAITYKAADTLKNKDRSSCAQCANFYNAQKMRDADFRDHTQLSKIQNISRKSGNLAGARGVYVEKGRYRARIRFQGKIYSLGTYDTLPEAIKAREEGERKLYGEFLASEAKIVSK